MKNYFTLLFFLLPFLGFSQSSPLCGYKVFKGDQTSTDSSIREFTKVVTLVDGNVVYAGQADEGADANFSLTKTTNEGIILWQKVIGTDGLDVLKNFIITNDGGFVLVGWTTATGGTDPSDAIVIRCDPQGEVLWSKQIGGADDDEGFNATELTNGDLIVTGSTFSFGPKLKNAFAAKITSTGELVWCKGFAKGIYNYFIDAIALPNNGAILCGYTWVTTGSSVFDPMFVKVDSDGTVIWSKWIKMTGSQIVYDFEKDLDGGIVYAGVSSTIGKNQNFIAKISVDGVHQWAKLFGTPNGDRVWDLAVAPSGHYLTAGFTDKTSLDNSPRNGFMARLTSTGVFEEAIQYGAENDTTSTTFTGIAISGEYAFATGLTYLYGNTTGAGISSKLVALDFSQNCSSSPVSMPSTNLTAVDSMGVIGQNGGVIVESSVNSSVNNLIMEDICVFTGLEDKVNRNKPLLYPNPSSRLFSIQLPQAIQSTLLLFSSDGRKQMEQFQNGDHFNLDLQSLPSGLYHVKVNYGSKVFQTSLVKK